MSNREKSLEGLFSKAAFSNLTVTVTTQASKADGIKIVCSPTGENDESCNWVGLYKPSETSLPKKCPQCGLQLKTTTQYILNKKGYKFKNLKEFFTANLFCHDIITVNFELSLFKRKLHLGGYNEFKHRSITTKDRFELGDPLEVSQKNGGP